MRLLCEALDEVARTRSRTAKVDVLTRALRDVAARDGARLAFAARFVTGTMLPLGDDRTLGASGALLFEVAVAVTRVPATELGRRARASGDLGSGIGEAVASAVAGGRAPAGLTLEAAESLAFDLAATRSRSEKLRALEVAFAACTPPEARYLARAFLSEMRIGAKEAVVEEAIAKAFSRPLEAVRRAASLVSDIGEVAQLAFEDRLQEARVIVGRPLGFMLASPLDTYRGADVSVGHAVEDKIDGVRAQAHVGSEHVRLFARGKGSVTTAFPEIVACLADAARRVVPAVILDGEIVVVTPDGRPRPFSALQRRLKKTEPGESLLRSNPVQYVVYDILFEGDEALLSLPFQERRARLARWLARATAGDARVVLHDSRPLLSRAVMDHEFEAARARGHEGLVLKRLDAPYAAGVRGSGWLKVKKALATLDVVVVAAERGHGKRAGWLSDYTFAVRGSDELLQIGKAYSGLTDAEIKNLTTQLSALADGEERDGLLHVHPSVVLEVGFDGLQRSARHASGYALRFPRILRIRDDKTPSDADTLETVDALWAAQLASGHRETGSPESASKRDRNTAKASAQLKLFDP